MLRTVLTTLLALVVLLVALVHVQYVMLREKEALVNVVAPETTALSAAASCGGLRVLSYNVHGMPFFWLRNEARLGALKAFLLAESARHDVVCLQEVFSAQYREALAELFRGMGWTVAVSPPPTFPHFVSSGLLVASRLPMEAVHASVFETCALFDCFSTKGGIAVTVAGATVVNLHLQDATWDVTGNTRLAQAAALGRAYPGGAVFVGDFNVEKGDAGLVQKAEALLGPSHYPETPTFADRTLDAAYGEGVRGVEALDPGYDRFVSDHLPISVTIV